MRESKRLAAILATVGLLGWATLALQARTKKGDQLYAQGHLAEERKDYDGALKLYEDALALDPGDAAYLLSSRRVRFQSAQAHVDKAEQIRSEGKLQEALAEFQKAYSIDPSSPIAQQELVRTMQMIELDQKRTTPVSPEERGLTSVERARRDTDARMQSVMSVPILKPMSPNPIFFQANNRLPREIIETVCKQVGINVIFDSDTTGGAAPKPMNVQFTNASIEEILNYVALQAKLYWKPISANAVFVTVDTRAKRTEVEEQVTKVFYINNASEAADLQELQRTVTQITGATRVAPAASQGALIVRGTADQVALAEMLIRDLDRAKPEVVVDVILMEANRDRSRSLSSTLVSAAGSGISIPIGYSPRAGVTSGGTTGGTTLNNLGRTSAADFQVTLPGALLEAFMKDSGARILQSPQVRALSGKKASLKVGDKVPYSSGGFQPTFGQAGGTGAQSLYNSFQFLDTGVNVDITPTVQGTDEVTMHVEITVSNVKDRIDIGGISQPEVVNRNIINDIRLREGEVNLLGGLVNTQETKSTAGVPVLSSIPLLGRLFTSESIDKTDNELLIAIIPRIVRAPDLDDLNFKGIAVGGGDSIKLTYAPLRAAETPPAAPGAAAPAAAAPTIATLPAAAPASAPTQAVPAPTIAALPAAAPASTPTPAVPARVVFNPGALEVTAGGTVTVSLAVENVTDLFSAPLRFKFDPNVLRLDEVTRGNFLSGDGRDVLFTRNIQNSTGDVTLNLRRNTGVSGVSGSGTLVTLIFQVIGKGVTTVTAPGLSFLDSRGQGILSASPQMNVTIK
jgi:general secretion pathway protein D